MLHFIRSWIDNWLHNLYKTCRFSHDFELDLFIFHTFSSKFMTLNPPPFPGFPLWPDASSLSSWSCICASIPTRSSSTLWLIPGDVSIYLHPYFTANDLPTIKDINLLTVIFVEFCSKMINQLKTLCTLTGGRNLSWPYKIDFICNQNHCLALNDIFRFEIR